MNIQRRNFQRAEVKPQIHVMQFVAAAAQRLHPVCEGAVRREPRVHQHILRHGGNQIRVDNLPVAIGLVGVGNIRAILYHRAGRALRHQRLGHNVRARRGGMNRQFNPVHVCTFLIKKIPS